MNARFDEAVWAGAVRRMSDVEQYIPDAPAWRASTDAETTARGTITLGSAFGRTRGTLSQRSRLVRVMVVVAAVLALVGAAILVASRPQVDLRTGPFGPIGILRGSDGHSHAALLRDGRVLIVSGTWVGIGEAAGRADIWTPEGDLVSLAPPRTARVNPTVTLLLDGRVLVVGGYGGQYQYDSSAIASAEVWDPETERFTATGSMSTARVRHTATLLADGRVLVAGGSDTGGAQQSAEVWDPATGQFTPAGTMQIERAGHASVLLPSGEVVLIGGGFAPGVEAGRVEVWSPRSEGFRGSQILLDKPFHVSTTRLLDGRVFAAGVFIGLSGMSGVTILENPGGEIMSLSKQRDGHAATLLPDGDVVITGGWEAGTREPLDSAERWDLTSETFSEAATLPVTVGGHDAVLLLDGRILIVADASGPDGFVAPFIYDPVAPLATP